MGTLDVFGPPEQVAGLQVPEFQRVDNVEVSLLNDGQRLPAILFREILQFAMQNKAWWIVPTVLILLVLGVLIFSGQAVAPFIYTLF